MSAPATRSRALWRLLGAGSAGVIVALAAPLSSGWARAVTGWDAAALVYLAIVWRMLLVSSAADTSRRAAADDPGRGPAVTLALFGSAASLAASVVVFREAPSVLDAFAGVAVVTAWAVTHTAFTLHYAHVYYASGGGLEFPGGDAPDDVDFAYFAFTIGMAFQVSDVAVSGRALRRTVFAHALLSFAYNTVIVALALNLFFGLVH